MDPCGFIIPLFSPARGAAATEALKQCQFWIRASHSCAPHIVLTGQLIRVHHPPVPHAFQTGEAVDFVVVGSGASGGVMARELSHAGFTVLVLEQGRVSVG